jgi:transposase
VNDVRKDEHRALKAEGDETLEGTRWFWLYGIENLPEAHRPAFDRLKFSNLLTARAWALKETLRHLWLYKSEGWAMKHFKWWRLLQNPDCRRFSEDCLNKRTVGASVKYVDID